MHPKRTILIGAASMVSHYPKVDWQVREQLDAAWREYRQAALELRQTIRESWSEAMSPSGDDVLIESAATKRNAAYKRYQQAFREFADVAHRG
jgi:hypothetical protein